MNASVNFIQVALPAHSVPTDDLLHLMAVMVNKAIREPDTASLATAHAQRIFDKIVERIS